MTTTRETTDRPVPGYWDWVAVAMFLLVTVDLLTTLFAVASHGAGAESNPLVAWMLGQPVWVVVAANLAVVVLNGAFFYALDESLKATPAPYDRYFAIGVELWLGSLIAFGLFVFANNLAVIVLGGSLV